MRTIRTVACVLVAVAVASACDVSGLLNIGTILPPVGSSVQDRVGDATGPDTRYDIEAMSTDRRPVPGNSQTYNRMRVNLMFVTGTSVRLPPPASHPATSGAELAWALCIDTDRAGGYVINPSVPSLQCDHIVDGGALTQAQGGAGRLADGTYRLLRVTSSSPLQVSDTGARATVEVAWETVFQFTVDISPLQISDPNWGVWVVFAAGNRNGGGWNITDFAPDGAVGTGK